MNTSNVEIFYNHPDGFAEGKQDEPLEIEEIQKYLLNEHGFKSRDIQIWYDDFMGLWLWNAIITLV